jgi:hypothetical protein
VTLDQQTLDRDVVEQTLGVLLKHQEDIRTVSGERLEGLLGRTFARVGQADSP